MDKTINKKHYIHFNDIQQQTTSTELQTHDFGQANMWRR